MAEQRLAMARACSRKSACHGAPIAARIALGRNGARGRPHVEPSLLGATGNSWSGSSGHIMCTREVPGFTSTPSRNIHVSEWCGRIHASVRHTGDQAFHFIFVKTREGLAFLSEMFEQRSRFPRFAMDAMEFENTTIYVQHLRCPRTTWVRRDKRESCKPVRHTMSMSLARSAMPLPEFALPRSP